MAFSARHVIRGVARCSAMHAIRLSDVDPAPMTGQAPGGPDTDGQAQSWSSCPVFVRSGISLFPHPPSILHLLRLATPGPKHETAEGRRMSVWPDRAAPHQLNRPVMLTGDILAQVRRVRDRRGCWSPHAGHPTCHFVCGSSCKRGSATAKRAVTVLRGLRYASGRSTLCCASAPSVSSNNRDPAVEQGCHPMDGWVDVSVLGGGQTALGWMLPRARPASGPPGRTG